MHWVIASLPPDTVTARSVEFGSISLATWIEAPVISRISLIFEPPFPIREPHWDAGTTSRKVMGGRGTLGVNVASRSSSNFSQISVNALWIDLLLPITVTMRSGQDPSVMLIFAPLCKEISLLVVRELFLRSLPPLEISSQCLPSCLLCCQPPIIGKL